MHAPKNMHPRLALNGDMTLISPMFSMKTDIARMDWLACILLTYARQQSNTVFAEVAGFSPLRIECCPSFH